MSSQICSEIKWPLARQRRNQMISTLETFDNCRLWRHNQKRNGHCYFEQRCSLWTQHWQWKFKQFIKQFIWKLGTRTGTLLCSFWYQIRSWNSCCWMGWNQKVQLQCCSWILCKIFYFWLQFVDMYDLGKNCRKFLPIDDFIIEHWTRKIFFLWTGIKLRWL